MELEEVEELKDKLNKHLSEIKKLFGVDEIGGADEDDEEDEELKNKKLFDQIQKLREIIEENRKFLEGEEIEELSPEERAKEEEEQKEKEEKERKLKEEDLRMIKEIEFTRVQEDK